MNSCAKRLNFMKTIMVFQDLIMSKRHQLFSLCLLPIIELENIMILQSYRMCVDANYRWLYEQYWFLSKTWVNLCVSHRKSIAVRICTIKKAQSILVFFSITCFSWEKSVCRDKIALFGHSNSKRIYFWILVLIEEWSAPLIYVS